MKIPNIALALFFLGIAFQISAQEKTIPSAIVKSLEGKDFNMADLTNDGKPMVINFWPLGAPHASASLAPSPIYIPTGKMKQVSSSSPFLLTTHGANRACFPM